MRSGPSLWRYLILLVQSGILPCSPNSLPIKSKTNSTHCLLTSSTLVANVWLSTEPFHLSLSRLECLKAVFWAQSYSWSSSMISLTLENPLYPFADDSTLCHDIPHPSDRQVVASPLSSDQGQKPQTDQTFRIYLSILRNIGSQAPAVTTIFVVSVCRSVCLSVCLWLSPEHSSMTFDAILMKLGHKLDIMV